MLLQSCPTLGDPMDYSPPGSSVHGILQARILEWVAMLSSRGSSWPGIRLVSLVSPASAGRFPLCMDHPSPTISSSFSEENQRQNSRCPFGTVQTYMASVSGLQFSLWNHHNNLIFHLLSPPPGILCAPKAPCDSQVLILTHDINIVTTLPCLLPRSFKSTSEWLS